MVISIASGKGGTGKTTIAASLAYSLQNSLYLDCDVEEPNGHLLLHPDFHLEERAIKTLPEIDSSKCTVCGKCAEVCEFNALINLQSEIMLIEEMCHSCGACEYFCPEKAINEVPKQIGVVRTGYNVDGVLCIDGVLNVGEISAVPLIKIVKRKTRAEMINIIDSPPGTSCSMVETVRESDYCILVTESSPFGLSDLELAVKVVQTLGVPFGVIINKYDVAYTDMVTYLKNSNIDLLMKIPFSREVAQTYSEGVLPVSKDTIMKENFIKLFQNVSNTTERNNRDGR